jgi:hypothetical protein
VAATFALTPDTRKRRRRKFPIKLPSKKRAAPGFSWGKYDGVTGIKLAKVSRSSLCGEFGAAVGRIDMLLAILGELSRGLTKCAFEIVDSYTVTIALIAVFAEGGAKPHGVTAVPGITDTRIAAPRIQARLESPPPAWQFAQWAGAGRGEVVRQVASGRERTLKSILSARVAVLEEFIRHQAMAGLDRRQGRQGAFGNCTRLAAVLGVQRRLARQAEKRSERQRCKFFMG